MSPYPTCFGPVLLFGATFFWALSNVLFSFASKSISTPVAIFWVYFIQTMYSLFLYSPGKKDLTRAKLFPVFSMAFYLILSTAALGLANPADCLAIASIQIFITPVLSKIILNQQFQLQILLPSIIVCTTGMCLLVQPSFLFKGEPMTFINYVGLLSEAVGVIGLSFLLCLQRITHQSEYELAFWSNAIVASVFLFSSIFQIVGQTYDLKSVAYLLACATSMFIGTVTSFAGWKHTVPVVSSMISQSNLAFTFLLSCFVGFETEVGLEKLCGLFLIFGSVLGYLLLTRKNIHRDIVVGPFMSRILGIDSHKESYFEEEL